MKFSENFSSKKEYIIFLLPALERFGIAKEIWFYFTIRDIINLLCVSSSIREMARRLNENTSFNIDINISLLSESENKNIFVNLLNSFPNISKLKFFQKKIGKYFNSYRNPVIDTSLEVFYNSKLLNKSLTELSLKCLDDDVSLIGISNLNNLTFLDISLSCLTDDAMHYISPLSNLTSLSLSDNYISDDGLCTLSSLINLKTLNISHTRDNISNNGLSYISHSLVNLTSIDFTGCHHIKDLGFPILSSFSKLTSLSASHYTITDIGLEYLSASFGINMTYLDCKYCHQITNIGMSYLSLLTNLTFLNLSNCQIVSTEGYLNISKLVNLTFLNTGSSILSDVVLSHFCYLTKLTSVGINSNLITTTQLYQFLESLFQLEVLELYCNKISIIEVVISYISKYEKLKKLSLVSDDNEEVSDIFDDEEDNNIYDNNLCPEVMQKLLKLEVFDLQGDQFMEVKGVIGLKAVHTLFIKQKNL